MDRKLTDTVPQRYLHLVDAALSLQQAGEHEYALDVLLKARKEAPADASVHLLIGIAQQDMGRLNDAEASIRQALKLDPEYPDALQALGLLLSARDRFDEAADVLERHLRHSPADITSLKALTAALAQQNREDDAVSIFSEAYETTENYEVGLELGRFLMRVRRLDDAESLLGKMSQETESAEVLVEWAAVLTMNRKTEDAIDVLQKAIASEPDCDRAWRGLAYCLHRMERLEDALAASERAISLDSGHYRNWHIRSEILFALQRYDDTLTAARRGIELIDPDDPEAGSVLRELTFNAIAALVNTGQYEDALVRLIEARRRYPDWEVFAHLQALMLVDANRLEEALLILDEALRIGTPADSELAPLRYQVLHELGRPGEAWASIEPTLSTHPEKRLHMLANQGVMLYLRGEVEAAKAVFEQLCDFAPDESRFNCNLGFVLTGTGDFDSAEEYLMMALESPADSVTSAVVLANLGYLCLIRGDLTGSERYLREAQSVAGEEDIALLRIAYWRDGAVVQDDFSHPRQWLPIHLAVEANLVTLALAQGDAARALEIAENMVDKHPETPLGHRMRGWTLVSTGHPDLARDAWRTGLDLSRDAEEQEIIAHWLDTFPD